MNAVIVDIRKKQAAALDETGRVVRIPNADYEIGQTIELHAVKPVRTPTMLKRLSTGVAAAVLVAMIGTGTAYAMPYGTVTLDGDSSIEYTINCFDYVLDIKAINEEGETLLAEIDEAQLRHHRIDTAIGTTVERMERRGDFDQENVDVHINADTKNEDHSERLREELAPVVERDQRPTEAMRDEPLEGEASERPSPKGQSDMGADLTPHPADAPRQENDAVQVPAEDKTPILPEHDHFSQDAFALNSKDVNGAKQLDYINHSEAMEDFSYLEKSLERMPEAAGMP